MTIDLAVSPDVQVYDFTFGRACPVRWWHRQAGGTATHDDPVRVVAPNPIDGHRNGQ